MWLLRLLGLEADGVERIVAASVLDRLLGPQPLQDGDDLGRAVASAVELLPSRHELLS
jgi:hypothetical protein